MAQESGWATGTPRNILLATDLSARCDRALDRAACLARTWGARLSVLHVLEQTNDLYDTALASRLPSWRRPPSPARSVEEELRQDVTPLSEDVAIIIEKGKPTESILRVAAMTQCDMIVTGIARDETLGRFGLGTTVNRLVRRSRVPVLVVKQRVRGPYKHVVVATDFSDSSLHAVRAAAALFPDEQLSVFHAYEAPMAGIASDPVGRREAYRSLVAVECAKFLEASGILDTRGSGVRLLLEPGHPTRLLHQFVRDQEVDLVVLSTHGRSALFHILIGSTATEILSSLPCDVLVIREPPSAVGGKRRLT